MSNNVFTRIKAAMGDATAELARLRAKLETKRRRREYLIESPLPRADVDAAIVARVDQLGADYPRQLARYLAGAGVGTTKHEKLPRLAGHINPLCLRSGTGVVNETAPPILQESALCYIFGDVLKARLAAALAEVNLDWPAEVGPPAAERAAELATLEREIAELEAAESALLAELKAAVYVDATAEQPNYLGGTPTARTGKAAL